MERIETKLAQIGSTREEKTGAINFPVYYATAYRHPGPGESTGYDYTRTANPTRDVLEESIASLEEGDRGFACSSGMAAIQTVMGLFSSGDHLLVSRDLYGGTYRLFEEWLTRLGLTFTYVDFCDLREVEQSIRPETKAFFVETPTNPLLHVIDIVRVSKLAESHGILTIVDNTFMTPYYQKPLTLGADIVIHSATKYLGGHNDVLAGLIVTGNEALSEKIGFLQNTAGAVLGPQDSWLLMRGMKTLALRMEKHQQNAMELAKFLQEHPMVDEVFYPGLPYHPGYHIQTGQANGFGGMISFRLKKAEWVAPLLRHLKLIAFAESLGGVETFMTYPETQTHADMPRDFRERSGVCNRLLRLSVGIEHVKDLKADLSEALTKAEVER
ncbi:MAG: aminotransferase class I/II-fold pyridoxal phosphate-dependent enzyme [Bacillaceae bacterium]|nr:aminotransferase class I/II-fold pyridoxal phosphate-dependent enzyme [Bacillaceae bacterium]